MVHSPELIARWMATYDLNPTEQVRQIEYRLQLAEIFGIESGTRVLEIGCGQGDMTAALAAVVGPHGHVVGIDPAPPTYGAPITVGESIDHLKQGPLGNRLTIHLNFQDWSSLSDEFDVVVMAHCAWYFGSAEVLLETLMEARSRCKSLCLSEWNLVPRHRDQMPHAMAVTFQSLLSAFLPGNELNVQRTFRRQELIQAAEATGWHITENGEIEQPSLDDGKWEVRAFLDLLKDNRFELPDELRVWLEVQADAMREYPQPYSSLPILWFRAV